MKKNNLSVIVIAKDEEQIIKECLDSVKWADEIVVVIDDRTTDKTAQIVRNYTQKVFFHKFETFSEIKQYALKKARGEWVLALDADEQATPLLKKEIRKKIQNLSFDGFAVYYRLVFLGKLLRQEERTQGAIRLFKRARGNYTDAAIHERVIVKGKVGILENPILHHSHQSIYRSVAKFNEYTSLEAKHLFETGVRTNILKILLSPVYVLFFDYVIQKKSHDGSYGLVRSLLYSIYVLLEHLKLWELQQKELKETFSKP